MPDWQGLKAGAKMIEWGIRYSEGSGLPIYVEASPSTWTLYQSFGFEKIKESVVHSKELLRTEEDIEVPLMVRMPEKANGMTFDEWRSKGYPKIEENAV